MTSFRIVPANLDASFGWVVKTTHDSGITETSIVYASRAKAELAVASWTHLDEDWASV
jgi:hypothetical protein